MHCVYDAFVDHIVHLGRKIDLLSYDLYIAVRKGVGIKSREYTRGCIVPALVTMLAGLYGYSTRIQHTLWDKKCYEDDAGDGTMNHIATWLVNSSDFGEYVDEITLEPAIYLLLNSQHAMFSEKVPKVGRPVMAVQMVRRCICIGRNDDMKEKKKEYFAKLRGEEYPVYVFETRKTDVYIAHGMSFNIHDLAKKLPGGFKAGKTKGEHLSLLKLAASHTVPFTDLVWSISEG